MKIAAVHFSSFAPQVSRERAAFTFTDGGELLVFQAEGRNVVPLWSSLSRLVRIQERNPLFRKYECLRMSLEDLLSCLTQLEAQEMRVGVNWAGKDLIGYDVEPEEMRTMLSGLADD
jgi:hypothetical protein